MLSCKVAELRIPALPAPAADAAHADKLREAREDAFKQCQQVGMQSAGATHVKQKRQDVFVGAVPTRVTSERRTESAAPMLLQRSKRRPTLQMRDIISGCRDLGAVRTIVACDASSG